MNKDYKFAFQYEIAYAKTDTKAHAKYSKIKGPTDTQAINYINQAEYEIKSYKEDKIKADILEELIELKPDLNKNLIEIRKIEFQEFDSHRWHGSGYYRYEVYADKMIAKRLGRDLNKAI